MEKKHGIVIGAGFAGLSAAVSLAAKGHRVTVLEKNRTAGGRARTFSQEGFLFDMGPSWYWMPDVMEGFFRRFGRSVNDYFDLVRLDPSYQVILSEKEAVPIPADFEALRKLFESRERGAGERLDRFIREAGAKYAAAMDELIYRPFLNVRELGKIDWWRALRRFDLFRSVSSHARRFFRDPVLLQLVEFPSLFLGAKPSRTPALYTLMNYADMKLGTWYPLGGMYRLVRAMEDLAKELGVRFQFEEPVQRIEVASGTAHHVLTNKSRWAADFVVAASDYHHAESRLLDESSRSYSTRYWDRRVMAPSCLLYYLGVNKKLRRLEHHNLFFDEALDAHADSIYRTRTWPERPLFYVCAPSVTDDTVAPPGHENLFVLIPVAAGLRDTPEVRDRYFRIVMRRLSAFCGEDVGPHIVFSSTYAGTDFERDYNAYRGNAYGLANTLRQTAVLRPSMRSRKVNNLYFAGQLTVPGPGVPPAIISGQVVADCIENHLPAL